MSDLTCVYKERYEKYLVPTAELLEGHLKNIFNSARVDRVATRAKSPARFMHKAMKHENGKPKYADPLSEIFDQVGARIIVFYPCDVLAVSGEVRRYFHAIENKILTPDTDNEFGYVGEHYVLSVPSDVLIGTAGAVGVVNFFELQIKTLFQHAWAEAEHDLGYKTTTALTTLQKRKLAFTAAQAWGADQIFDELFEELHKQHSERSM